MIVLCLALATGVSTLPAGATEPECPALSLNPRKVWTKHALEDALIAELPAFTAQTHEVDWQCLSRTFEKLSPRTSVRFISKGGLEGADVYRFTLDRSNNLFAVMRAWGPGASNGVFVAIFNQYPDGRIAVIRVGGRPELIGTQ